MDFSNMTLREKVLQTFIVTNREIYMHGGPEKFFENYPVGGVFYRWVAKTDDVISGTGMTTNTLERCRKSSKYPLMVCADSVKLEGQESWISARSVAASENLDDAYNLGKTIGMQFNSKGVDWYLGPVVDVDYDSSFTIHPLVIGGDSKLTAKISRAIIAGLHDQGVCTAAKHFPGLGTNNINMHFGPGKNSLSFDEWMKTYGYIYKEVIDEGVTSIMTTHVSLPCYDNETHDGYLPIATYSRKLSTELLKEKFGFEGAIVTDALIMGGMATGNLVAETVQAFKSGADFLLWPPVEAADRIVELLESGEIPMSRLDDALKRITKMRKFREAALKENRADEPSLEFLKEKHRVISKNGLCLLRNNINLIPLSDEKIKKVLIIDISEGKTKAPHMFKKAIEKRGVEVDVRRDIYDTESFVCWQSDIDSLQEKYDIVLMCMDSDYSVQRDPVAILIWASHLFDKKKKIIVNFGSPRYAVDFLPEDPTYIEMNSRPHEDVVEDAVKCIWGEMEFTGKPVLKEENVI